MRSIKLGLAAALGAPFAVAWLLAKVAVPVVGANFEGVLFLAVVLWLLVAAAVLLPAALRVWLGRRWGRWPGDQDRIWRQRQGSAYREGLKILAAVIVAFGLLIWTERSFVSRTPESHDVRIVLPAEAASLTVKVPAARAADCPEQGVVRLSVPGPAAARVLVGGDLLQPIGRRAGGSSYRIPLRSERSTYSCYLDFPKMFSHSGAVPVHLYVKAQGAASDSTPQPDRYLDGYWGWGCRAVPRGTGCATLAVLNDDPASEASSLAVVVTGAAFAVVISLLVSVVLALWRGWIADLGSTLRLVRRHGLELFASPPAD